MQIQGKFGRISNSGARVWLTAVLLWVTTLLVLLAGITKPNVMLFDENSFVTAARTFLAGTGSPTPYGPPLGQLLITFSMSALGDNPVAWRMPGVVFGALTVAGVFLLVNVLLGDFTLALAGAILALVNNILYVLSRLAMMDIFLVSFSIWGVLAFAAAVMIKGLRTPQRRALLLGSGLLFGFSCASKWNGIDTLGVVTAIATLLFLWPSESADSEMVQHGYVLRQIGAGWCLISFFVVPVLVYVATFWPLCRIVGLPFSFQQVVSVNKAIWIFHRTHVTNMMFAERWYTWPFKRQPVRVLSYLVGNWYVMWGGLVALLFCLRRFARNLPETLIVLLYAANLLQWAVTPQPYLYYYYYFPCAMFLGIAIPVALHRLPERYIGVRLSIISVIPAICVFLYCLPHMAGLTAPYDSMLGYWP